MRRPTHVRKSWPVVAMLLLAGCGAASNATSTLTTAGTPLDSTTAGGTAPTPKSAPPGAMPPPGSTRPVPSRTHEPPTAPTASASAGVGVAGTATAGPAQTVTPSTVPPTTPTPADPAHLTESDTGQTIHVVVGQQVQVELGGGSGGSYDQPQSTTAVMRRTAASGGYPTDKPARATFVATTKGTADLVASTDYPCLHATPPCEIAQREWVVHVVVR